MQTAIACIHADRIRGCIRFFPQYPGVMVTAEIFGLSDGFHGFHIHTGGSCCGENFSDTLGHFDPQGRKHPEHAGDLPPLLSCNARAYMAVLTDRFELSDIIGRTVVIHSQRDDFTTQPAGDSGRKIACGVIRLTN